MNNEDASGESSKQELTERELEITLLMADGLTLGQIGEKLFISIHTMRTHRDNIYYKTKCRNRAAIVNYVRDNKLYKASPTTNIIDQPPVAPVQTPVIIAHKEPVIVVHQKGEKTAKGKKKNYIVEKKENIVQGEISVIYYITVL